MEWVRVMWSCLVQSVTTFWRPCLLCVLLMDVADEHALEFFILICQMFVKTVNTTLNLD